MTALPNFCFEGSYFAFQSLASKILVLDSKYVFNLAWPTVGECAND